MKRSYVLAISCFIYGAVAAQKGNNDLQVGVHTGIAVSNLSRVANMGIGAAVKGLWGFSEKRQQVGLSLSYTSFRVKKSITGDDKFHYTTIPLLAVYRYNFGGNKYADDGFYLEAQVGGAYNEIKGRESGVLEEVSNTSFAWGTTLGYTLKGVDISAGYFGSDLRDTDVNLTFVGIQLAYNFLLKKKGR